MSDHETNERTRSSVPAAIMVEACRRPWTVVAVAGVVTVLCVLSVLRITPAGTIDALLAVGDESAEALLHITRDFRAGDELSILVTDRVCQAGDSIGAGHRLLEFAGRFENALTSSADVGPLCGSVSYGQDQELHRFIESVIVPNAFFYLDDSGVEQLLKRLHPDSIRERIQRVEQLFAMPSLGGGAMAEAALQDPLGLRLLFIESWENRSGLAANSPDRGGALSQDGCSLLIRIGGLHRVSDLDYAKALTGGVRRIIASLDAVGLDIELSGSYAIAAHSEQAIRRDMIRSILFSVVGLFLLFLMVYRSPWRFPLAVTPVAFGILVSFGLYACVSTTLTPVTGVVAAILAGLGVDYCIHYLALYEDRRRAHGVHLAAVREAAGGVGPAMAAACMTSLIGFLAIAQSRVPALRAFSLLGAMGLACSLLACYTILPALLTLFPARTDFRRGSARLSMRNTMAKVTAHPRIVLAGSLCLVGLLGLGTMVGSSEWMAFERDLTVMHPKPNPPLETQGKIARIFGLSADSFLLHVEADSPEQLVHRTHEVAHRMRQTSVREAGVVGTYGLSTLLPDPNMVSARLGGIVGVDVGKVLAAFDRAVASSSFTVDAFASYRKFLQSVLAPIDPPTLARLADYPQLSTKLLPEDGGHFNTQTPHQTIQLVRLDKPWSTREARDQGVLTIRSALADLEGVVLTGMTVIGMDTERTIRHDLATFLKVALGLVGIWLLVYFRSLRSVLLALIPVALGLLCLVCFMRVAGERMNIVNLLGVPLVVGLGVDDGIFLVSLARVRRQHRCDRKELVVHLASSCHAVVMTSVTTVLTFGTLAFTTTPAIQSLGRVMAVGIGGCLAGSLFLLVPTLILTASKDHECGGDVTRV